MQSEAALHAALKLVSERYYVLFPHSELNGGKAYPRQWHIEQPSPLISDKPAFLAILKMSLIWLYGTQQKNEFI